MHLDVKTLLEGLASILYGALALVLLFVLALRQGSVTAALLTVAAAGATYVFQETQRHSESPIVALLAIAPVILAFLAFIVIGIGA